MLTKNVWDKALHGAGYGVLGLLYWWALRGERVKWHVAAALAIVLASAYAASDEFHQRFTPGRMPDVRDWAADTIGASIAVAATGFFRR